MAFRWMAVIVSRDLCWLGRSDPILILCEDSGQIGLTPGLIRVSDWRTHHFVVFYTRTSISLFHCHVKCIIVFLIITMHLSLDV